MNERRAARNRHLLQLLDAFLIWAAFRAASQILDPDPAAAAIRDAWILYLAVPFTPLILEGVGYYRPRSTAALNAFVRLVGAISLMGLVLVVFASLVTLRPAGASAIAMALFFSVVLIFARDRSAALFPKANGGLP